MSGPKRSRNFNRPKVSRNISRKRQPNGRGKKKAHKIVKKDRRSEHSKQKNRSSRRGVSVFQQQLHKRKVWVEQYEESKKQKVRDKRRQMRQYYRAMKDLRREKQRIFGNSNREEANDENNLRPNDVWSNINRRKRYKDTVKLSDWSLVDNPKNYDIEERKRQRREKREKQLNIARGNDSYFKAKREAKINREKEREKQEEIRKEKQEKRKRIEKYENHRRWKDNIYKKKTKKGQPNLNARMTVLFQTIQSKYDNTTKKNQKRNRNKNNTNKDKNSRNDDTNMDNNSNSFEINWDQFESNLNDSQRTHFVDTSNFLEDSDNDE